MNDKAITKVSQYFENDMVRSRFREVLGSRETGAYISSVLLAVADSEQLQECSLPSIYSSALRAATLRLSVDPNTGQAYLVPFKGKATLIVGYKGLHDMAVRTGKYRYINVTSIWEGETVIEDRITGFHSITGKATSKTVIGWLAAFEMYAGYGHTMYMTVDEIHAHAKKYSKSYGNQKSGWTTDTDKMERKTVLRLLLRRWGYLDPTDAATLDEVESEAGIIDGEVREVEPEPPQPEQKRSELEILSDMGYDVKQPEGAAASMTLEQAREVKTPKGTPLEMLDLDQVQEVINKSRLGSKLHQAAVIVLASWDPTPATAGADIAP